MYSSKIRSDYTLADAFHALGVRLYGPKWTGYEIWRHKTPDPTPYVQARGSIEIEIEQLATELFNTQQEQKDVVLPGDISRVNDAIRDLKKRRDDLFFQFHKIKNVSASDVEDHERWVRLWQAPSSLDTCDLP